ncbi:MAG: cytochrome P450 [Pseudomonadota bacterium]
MNALVPNIKPHMKPLGVLESVRAARRNVLEVIPAICYVQPMITGWMGSRWHMVQDPAVNKRVFLDNVGNYPKAEVMIRMVRPAVGDSLFTAEGADWRWQRRTVAPVFAQRNVVALAPFMTETAERAAARLAEDGPHEVVGEMLSATFDVICDVALSGRDHFDAEIYGAAILRYFETAGRASLLDFLQVPDWVPRPGALLGRGAVKTMHRMVADAIEARRAETGPAGGMDDLLDHMISAEDPESGRKMSPTDLLHNMQFFIVAGHETTALALGWALYLLSSHPHLQEHARDECRRVLGDRPAGAADLAAMPYVRQVLDEAMRLYPPVGFLARTAAEPDVLGGREVRKGEIVFLAIYALHRHEMWWDKPNEFDPDNFTDAAIKARHRYLHLPFGAGPRVCVGANFAMMQAQIILATLLARYRFSLSDAPVPTPIMHMTLRPDTGVVLKAEPV